MPMPRSTHCLMALMLRISDCYDQLLLDTRCSIDYRLSEAGRPVKQSSFPPKKANLFFCMIQDGSNAPGKSEPNSEAAR